jgi:glutamate-5-semialdehyde dehydrogenase
VQISSLAIKSGNVCILKGGSEAKFTNKVLFDLIYDEGIKAGFPENFMVLAESRDDIKELLNLSDEIDLIIPRGSNEFVKYIMDNTKIPVMGHSDGICHIFVDKSADQEKAIPLIVNAKINYPSACNAVETVLIDKEIEKDFLPKLLTALKENNVEVRAGDDVDFTKEYLDKIVNIGIASDLSDAISHINHFGSHHTDAIITEDESSWKKFSSLVDSASVYKNASTRFADGKRYGFGAEVGISTGKIHARGPVGPSGLTTYKYILEGDYNIVG